MQVFLRETMGNKEKIKVREETSDSVCDSDSA